jgi:Activator of Hsp90 ATPase homolog 1-like protein
MESRDYQITIKANISAEEALEKINRVSQWWTKGITGKADRLGDRFTMRSRETFVDLQVVELEPNARIVWEVTDCYLHFVKDKTEWKGTRIVWAIASKNRATEVRMTHIGLFPDVECYDVCKAGWDFHVRTSLLRLLAENIELTEEQERSNNETRRRG